MEIRPITPDDIPAYRHIVSHSFARGRAQAFGPEVLEQEGRTGIGAYDAGRLQATLGILDFHAFFGQNRLPCGGICGITCDPAARGRGYAGALVRRSLEVMRDRGQFISMLWPFDFRYYRQFGWDWTGRACHYSVPVAYLISSPESAYVEGLDGDYAAILNPLYEEIAMRYNGPLVRTEPMWQGLTKAHGDRAPAVYVYRRDGVVEGCVIVRYTDREEDARACEFFTRSARAYRGLLALLHHHSMSVKNFHWDAPEDDGLWQLGFNWDVETKLRPCGMSRVVDVRAALQAIRPEGTWSGTVDLKVDDAAAPWNAACWRIEIDAGVVRVTRSQREPGVVTDIQTLTQAYWGTPDIAALRRMDRLTVAHEEAYTTLARLVPPRAAWLADDF